MYNFVPLYPCLALLVVCSFLENELADLRRLKQVKQFYLIAHHEQHIPIVHHLLKSHISQVPEYKVGCWLAAAVAFVVRILGKTPFRFLWIVF